MIKVYQKPSICVSSCSFLYTLPICLPLCIRQHQVDESYELLHMFIYINTYSLMNNILEFFLN